MAIEQIVCPCCKKITHINKPYGYEFHEVRKTRPPSYVSGVAAPIFDHIYGVDKVQDQSCAECGENLKIGFNKSADPETDHFE